MCIRDRLGTTPSAQAVVGNASVGGTFDVVGAVNVDDFTATGTVNLTAATTTVATPTQDSHAATKGYVDTEVNAILDGAPAALDTLNELAAAINDDANVFTTLTNSIATKLSLAGGTMTGNIDMGSNKITSSTTPTADSDLTRKAYVDDILGSATEAATSATNAANSASSAATSATNASNSATTATTQASNASTSATSASGSATASANSATASANSATASAGSATSAATSATAAANSFDAFDDIYLGAKASDPTLDNDGDALQTGAIYYNTTDTVMRVYNGTSWADATSAVNGTSNRDVYTATAGQTTFSAIYDVGYVDVYLNGVKLVVTTDFTATNGTSIVLTSGASVGDSVEVVGYGTFSIADTVSKADGGSFQGTITAPRGIGDTNTDTTNTGSVTLDFASNQNHVLTLTGNVTLANPSTESVGQSGFIVFIQDGTGGRTVSLGTDYETAGGAGLTLSATASATDVVPYIVAASGRILLGAPQLAFS
jgi:hypothetical protein